MVSIVTSFTRIAGTRVSSTANCSVRTKVCAQRSKHFSTSTLVCGLSRQRICLCLRYNSWTRPLQQPFGPSSCLQSLLLSVCTHQASHTPVKLTHSRRAAAAAHHAACVHTVIILMLHSHTHTHTLRRFKDDQAGEVIYETVRRGTVTSSYAGMRFPSGDIPLPARQLFMRNALRVIHDVNGQDSRIVGATLHTGAQLDLSMSSLRAVSKVRVHNVIVCRILTHVRSVTCTLQLSWFVTVLIIMHKLP
jgi:hypothetical protein